MLELAVLGMLKKQPMHGYDLRKQLRENFGPLANLSFGSLYPALSRLERAGAVRAVATVDQAKTTVVPPTGSLGGERATLIARRASAKSGTVFGNRSTRSRKIYEITEHGNALFEELLASPDNSDDAGGFSLRLAFARHLSPPARVRMLERRRVQLADRLQRSETSLDRPSRTLDTYERSIAEHSREAIERDLRWIEQLLTQEQRMSVAAAPIDPVSITPNASAHVPAVRADTEHLNRRSTT